MYNTIAWEKIAIKMIKNYCVQNDNVSGKKIAISPPKRLNVITRYWIISTSYSMMRNFPGIFPKFVDWALEYLKHRACRIFITSTKSSEAICSVFNEQTSIALKDADCFAVDKLISCLEDGNRGFFSESGERKTCKPGAISRIYSAEKRIVDHTLVDPIGK